MQQNIWIDELNPFQKFKALCHYERMKKIKTGNFAAPVNIALDLCQGTGAKKLCGGIKCNFCMSDLEDYGETARIPRDILFDIPRFYREWGVLSLCLAGHHSDPLSYNHDDFVQFLRLLYRNDIEVGINTNGYLLDHKLILDITRNCKWTGFSINAGLATTYARTTGSSETHFGRIIEHVEAMTAHCREYKIDHPVCYKFLITDDNYLEVYDAIVLAKKIGCRQIQIRPTQLTPERTAKIDVAAVEEQMRHGLELFEHGVFGVYGIREKFTPDLKKRTPKRCIATPLGSTWKADGDIVICPDRRWSAHQPRMVLGNFIKEGLEAIRRKWGGPEHIAMIAEANKHIGDCIRCTAYWWHELYENSVENDPMDVRLI
jgi:MoaA/NifB/PqqE/SkfB family radical SAM enzyme